MSEEQPVETITKVPGDNRPNPGPSLATVAEAEARQAEADRIRREGAAPELPPETGAERVARERREGLARANLIPGRLSPAPRESAAASQAAEREAREQRQQAARQAEADRIARAKAKGRPPGKL